MTPYLERALFVVAPPNSGKSTQLRAMFLDRRLGNGGRIPKNNSLVDTYHLSNERRLYLRLTSPHENREDPGKFIEKTKRKMDEGRWCFAGPLQPNAAKLMPDVVESVRGFQRAFDPERVRVIFLSPDRHGESLESYLPKRDLPRELHVLGAEVACIDAKQRTANGFFLADFFDFT